MLRVSQLSRLKLQLTDYFQGMDKVMIVLVGEFNSLKTLIMNDNLCAFYVHCFAHQLELAFVVMEKKHVQIASFFQLSY